MVVLRVRKDCLHATTGTCAHDVYNIQSCQVGKIGNIGSKGSLGVFGFPSKHRKVVKKRLKNKKHIVDVEAGPVRSSLDGGIWQHDRLERKKVQDE